MMHLMHGEARARPRLIDAHHPPGTSQAQIKIAFPKADSRSPIGHSFEMASAILAWQAGLLARDIRQQSSRCNSPVTFEMAGRASRPLSITHSGASAADFHRLP
jgi:hypothetical protein